MSALAYEKPFLAPLYAYAAIWRTAAVVPAPLFILMILRWIAERVGLRRLNLCGQRSAGDGAAFRGDAKAEGMVVVVAGWAPARDDTGRIRKGESPWFMVSLTPENAPWAFRKGLPYRSIMALELFTVLLMVMVLEPPAPEQPPTDRRQRKACLSAFSDSEGGTHVVAKGASAAFPLCLLSMELSLTGRCPSRASRTKLALGS